MQKPRLAREFGNPVKKQDDAFEAYNNLLDTVDPEKVASALSMKALDLSYEPKEGIEKRIVKTAAEVIDNTNNGTQIGFGKENNAADAIWGMIHNDPGHHEAASRYNTGKYDPNMSPKELERLCQKRGYHALAAVARLHTITDQGTKQQTHSAA